ncbi:hypothetical protein J1605_016042 [Eschrichtius robustus]|uniref:Uncharacterized protein n=1 Tax=Eschrichtius robustus TaxID=9764 RepID=A0AB34GB36_ESCRO|nr:hypothetical protein J1605_016042 [Eschrichtius robustus]
MGADEQHREADPSSVQQAQEGSQQQLRVCVYARHAPFPPVCSNNLAKEGVLISFADSLTSAGISRPGGPSGERLFPRPNGATSRETLSASRVGKPCDRGLPTCSISLELQLRGPSLERVDPGCPLCLVGVEAKSCEDVGLLNCSLSLYVEPGTRSAA